MRYEVNAVMLLGSPGPPPALAKYEHLCLCSFAVGIASVIVTVRWTLFTSRGCVMYVGSSSQADHLMRNAAMDDSIGGS